jgi:GNAT superfamily N-acetyltransferase
MQLQSIRDMRRDRPRRPIEPARGPLPRRVTMRRVMIDAMLVFRPIDPRSSAEVALVAGGMRRTLVEVLGEERGTALYTMEWLVERVLWHLDPGKSAAQVFLAEARDGSILGHTIVRRETAEDGLEYGLFSTTYVDPAARRRGAATGLLRRGEEWMIGQGMRRAVTYTAAGNTGLVRLYERFGYVLRTGLAHEDGSPMVELAKALPNAREQLPDVAPERGA